MAEGARKDKVTVKDLLDIIADENGLFMLPDTSHDLVYPNIYISEESLVRNKYKLKNIGITHVLNVAEGVSHFHVNLTAEFYENSGITYKGIKADDSPKFSFKPHLKEICDYIDGAIGQGGTVVVNCREGVSRSSTSVLAFLILCRNMTLVEALKAVREKRNIIPNGRFLEELIEIEEEKIATLT
ncbi:Dual specificity protein phosphatase 3 [Oopsacas minuta]|uniref:Dual specificity protein phosphatase n=1 Tax=Oopsacas minuta TaxID=111878 RepID=A0AAV7K8H0_9METZ|nr:Dual specificity protein phosphatase 3 [Oopsacas minuta]